MEIIHVQPDDPRIPQPFISAGGAQGVQTVDGPPAVDIPVPPVAPPRFSDDGREAWFQIGAHDKSGAPYEIAVAVENGMFVFMPERASAHAQLMDLLGIARGHLGD